MMSCVSILRIISRLFFASVIALLTQSGNAAENTNACDTPCELFEAILEPSNSGYVVSYNLDRIVDDFLDKRLAVHVQKVKDSLDGDIFTGLDGSDDWRVDSIGFKAAKNDRPPLCIVDVAYHGAFSNSSRTRLTFILSESGQPSKIVDIIYGKNTRLSKVGK
jgi:hypothetical protein